MTVRDHPSPTRSWLVATAVVSIGLVFGAPVLGQIQVALRGWTGPYYVAVVTFIAVVGIGAALAAAAARVRDRHLPRYGALLLAVAMGVTYSLTMRSGDAAVDVVESIHFLQYGLVAVLAYHAFRTSADAGAIVMPLLIGAVVSLGDEWLQWFVPARVGEVRDVALNLLAVVCGLLVGLSMSPPRALTGGLGRVSRRWVAFGAVSVVIAAAGFLQAVHLGHEIADSDTGVFRSRYSATELDEVSARRRTEWAARPPLAWSRFSREDQYFTEAMAHVRQRNRLWDAGDVDAAWQENQILERYYAPALDTPSWVSTTGHRWPPAQRADARARTRHLRAVPPSDALGHPVLLWPSWGVWGAAALICGLILHGVGRAA